MLDTSLIPHEPGCYFFKDSENKQAKILYIGKAKDLRKRVSQYFQSGRDAKTQAMIAVARHVDWIATPSEVDALLLEARLIRQHKPPYNMELKENRRYAWIKVTDEPFPRLVTTREGDVGRKSNLIGPFTDGTARVQLMTQARRLFRLRLCRQMPKRVCLYYHLGQCSGPCEGKISRESYIDDVERARLFMKGQAPELKRELESDMQRASAALQFEEAKRLRDVLRAVEQGQWRAVAAREGRYDEDVIVSARQEGQHVFLVLHVRKGMIAQADEFRVSLERVDGTAPLDDFVKSYYQEHAIPDEVLLESALVDDAITELLTRSRDGKRFTISVPKAGPKHALVDVARKNLRARIDQTATVLLQLQDALRLPVLPRRIDAFDNSHLQGRDLVSACVRFADGKPQTAQYRKFIIRTVEGNDDFAAMREAVSRRYKHAEDLPDLILIDGGKGQLMAAYHVLEELGYHVPIIGLAKREEEVFVPGLPEPLPIDSKSEPSLLLQRIRNEIHRFVISFHRARRGKRQVSSALDDIPGIGPETRARLLVTFKTIDGVRKASDDELRAVLSARQMVALRASFAGRRDVRDE